MVGTLHRLTGWASSPGGAEPGEVTVVKRAQEQTAEVNLIDAIGVGVQGDGLSGERFADETHAPLPFNLSVLAHPAQDPRARIAEGRRDTVAAWAAAIQLG